MLSLMEKEPLGIGTSVVGIFPDDFKAPLLDPRPAAGAEEQEKKREAGYALRNSMA